MELVVVELSPHEVPAHIVRVRRRVRAEQDFDHFMRANLHCNEPKH